MLSVKMTFILCCMLITIMAEIVSRVSDQDIRSIVRWHIKKNSHIASRTNNLIRPGFDAWVGKIPGEGNCNPLHYTCLVNPMNRGAWWATIHGVTKN